MLDARLPYSLKVLLENLLRHGEEEGAQADPRLGSARRAQQGDLVPARARSDAGLHRCAGHRGSGRHAGRDGRAGRRPVEDQPARARRARDRPLDPGRLVRRAARLPAQRRARVRAQRRALRVSPLGPGGVRQLRGGAAEHRHLPPGQPGVPRARGDRAGRGGVPRHPRRNRLPHHDGQRAGRARLGRGRHRGGGGDARPADLDAAAAGRGLPARGRAARGLHRHGPGADRDPDAARARRGGEVRRVLRARACPTCHLPTGRRSGTCRPRWARPAPSSRSTPRRSATSSSPAAPPTRSRSSRSTAASRASSTRPTPRTRPTRTRSSWTSATWCRAWPARKRPQDRVALSDAATDFEAELAELLDDGNDRFGPAEEALAESFPASDPPCSGPDRRAQRAGAPACRRGGCGARARRGARPRLGRDRRHHQLHQHLEPVGDDRRRPARQEGGRGGPRAQAVGQDLAGPGVQGRDRLPRARRPDRAAVAARLRPGRLRLHHLHRELRPAARGDLAGDRRARPGGLLGALGQPQLRGAHSPRGENELPRQSAAVRGLRADRPDGRGRRDRAPPGRRVPARHLAQPAGDRGGDRAGDRVGHVPQELRRGFRGRRHLEGRCPCQRATATPGTTPRPT